MSAEPIVSQFTGELQEVVNKFRDQGLTNAEAIGALEIVKLGVYDDAKEQRGDDWGDDKD